jgi:hypothetical protein
VSDREQRAFERKLAREQAAGFRARMTEPVHFVPVNEDDPLWRPIIIRPADQPTASPRQRQP